MQRIIPDTAGVFSLQISSRQASNKGRGRARHSACLICESIGFNLDWWHLHHTHSVPITCYGCGARGCRRSHFLPPSNGCQRPPNTHYRRHPHSSRHNTTLGAHAWSRTQNRLRQTNTQINLRLILWKGRLSSSSCQALNKASLHLDCASGLAKSFDERLENYSFYWNKTNMCLFEHGAYTHRRNLKN